MDRNIDIAIIGAGMGGLTTALALAKRGFTNISVYETASNLGFVGAGIQLAPNMARILDRLGCWEEIEKEAVDLKETSIRQGDTDAELGHVDLRYIRETYKYPHMVGHRSSLAGALYSNCLQYPQIKFNFSTSAVEVTSFTPKPTLKLQPRSGDPYTITPSILLASDGVKSTIRRSLLTHLNHTAEVIDTNQAAYRILLNRSQLESDPDLLALIDGESVTRWIGEKRHIIAYPISSKQIYNMSTIQPDTNFAAAPSATYTTKGSKSSMLAIFEDFCPKVRKLLELVPEGEVCEWKLRVHAPLPRWTVGRTALLGDACHPTLPHLAQGAAQAIEDAAVLAAVLDLCPDDSGESIGKALRVYEMVRKERAEMLVDLAAASGRALHLGDGEAKKERDRQFKEGKVPDKWADADVQKQIYGCDIVAVAEEGFGEMFKSLRDETV